MLGQTFNPVADLNDTELARDLQERYDRFGVGDRVATTNVTTLGTETRVSTFAGEARLVGSVTVDVRLHLTTVRHEGDFVVALGVHPRVLPDERDRVLDLVRGLDHPT